MSAPNFTSWEDSGGIWFYVTRNILIIIELNLRELALIIASCIFEMRTLCSEQGIDFSLWELFYLQWVVSAHTVNRKSSKWTWLWNLEVCVTAMRNNGQFWYRKEERGLYRGLLISLAWGWKIYSMLDYYSKTNEWQAVIVHFSCHVYARGLNIWSFLF